MKTKYIILCTVFLLKSCFSLDNFDTNRIWFDIFNSSESWINQNGKYFKEIIEKEEVSTKLSAICANQLIKFIDNISKEDWAVKMLDSMGHLPSGMTSGTSSDFGDFDQCIQINYTIDQSKQINGKYCLLTVKPLGDKPDFSNDSQVASSNWFNNEIIEWYELNRHFSFSNGICFPSVCEAQEIEFLLKQFFQVLNHFDSKVSYCQTKERPEYGTELYISLILIYFISILVIMGTVIDLISIKDHFSWKIFKCFSLIKNIKILFKISNKKSDTEYKLQFIHGLRVLGTIWVILAHSSGFVLVTLLSKVSPFARYPEDAINNSKTIISQYILNASLAVQIFFVMSGFLTVYSTLSKKKLSVSFIQFVSLRWLRFTPPLIGMMCFTISLQILGTGPIFQKELLEPFVEPCYNSWWVHILYIMNWCDLRKMCGIQTWYLGADFQLHILSFIVIYFFNKNQSISHWISYLMIAFGATIPVLLVAIGIAGIPRVDVLFKPKYEQPVMETTLFFFGTHMHLISYFFGTVIGYALLNRKFISIKKFSNGFIWLIVTVLMVTIPMLSYPMMQEDIHPVNYTVTNAIAVSLMLITWSVCVTWIIYNCAINRADVLSRILSANILHPLSRLSFCAYLTHIMLIWFNSQQTRYPIPINAVSISQYFCTILVETFGLALLLYLTFEAPFVNIIKLFFLTTNQHQSKTADDDDNNHSTSSQITINLKNINTNQ